MAEILSLSGIKARRSFENKANVRDERVFERVQRLINVLTSGGLSNKAQIMHYWNDSANALIQYLDNEFPVEKDNKCRADVVAEYAAILYASGIFDPQLSDKALELQTAVLDALEPENNDPVKNKFAAARANYGTMVHKLIESKMTHVQTEPQEPA